MYRTLDLHEVHQCISLKRKQKFVSFSDSIKGINWFGHLSSYFYLNYELHIHIVFSINSRCRVLSRFYHFIISSYIFMYGFKIFKQREILAFKVYTFLSSVCVKLCVKISILRVFACSNYNTISVVFWHFVYIIDVQNSFL